MDAVCAAQKYFGDQIVYSFHYEYWALKMHT